jgi:hypothetical protein
LMVVGGEGTLEGADTDDTRWEMWLLAGIALTSPIPPYASAFVRFTGNDIAHLTPWLKQK